MAVHTEIDENMSGPEYELGRRRLLQVTGASVVGATVLSSGVSAAETQSVEEAPEKDEYEEILDAMDGDGSEDDPYVITDVVELQAVNGDVTASYQLGTDIDASATAEWNDGAGFEPIFAAEDDPDDEDVEESDDGDVDAPDDEDDIEPPERDPDASEFTGRFDGNGYEIRGLTVDRPDELGAGLILINRGFISDLRLVEASVTGDTTGVVAGSNAGAIVETVADGSVTGVDRTGGLSGINTGIIFESEADVDVTGEDYAGGLAGSNIGHVLNSLATGAVEGHGNVGGLAGQSSGDVEHSYAEGDVAGTRRVGGFVGDQTGRITACVARGDVTGDAAVGGFTGECWGELLGSTAEGNVEGDEHVGGLVGENHGEVRVCSTFGDVTGSLDVGGLAGWNAASGLVNDSFTLGSVSGDSAVGALVGLLGWEFMNEGESVELQRAYWSVDDTDADPVGAIDHGDGDVNYDEQTVSGLESDQFVGMDASEHMTEFDFELQWRARADDVPVPVARRPSVFEIIDISSTAITVAQDETFDIELELENTGEYDGTQRIALVIDDVLFEVMTATLDVGEREQVVFEDLSASDIPVGPHTFVIQTADDAVDGTLEVESASAIDADDDTPAPGGDDGDDTSADDDGPGFGVPAAVTGVGTAAYLFSRRLHGADDE